MHRDHRTVPATNIAPENGWLEDFLVSFWETPIFQVRTAVSFREGIFNNKKKQLITLKPTIRHLPAVSFDFIQLPQILQTRDPSNPSRLTYQGLPCWKLFYYSPEN